MGRARVVRIRGERVGIARYQASDSQPDQLYAYEDRCTHDDAPLGESALEGFEVECPRHGARFDVRDGSVTCPPAYGPLEVYPAEIGADGHVWVDFN